LSIIGLGLSLFVILGALVDVAEKCAFGKVSLKISLYRLRGLKRALWGTFLGHLGVGITTLGIVVVSTFGAESVAEMHPKESQEIAGYKILFESLTPHKGINYDEEQGLFSIRDSQGYWLGSVISSKRFYPVRQMPTTEAGILTKNFSQIYISLGDKKGNGSIIVRLWYKPLITLIWGGAIVMVLGAILSLSDRRWRIGTPKRAPKRKVTA
jgi:cytochrome c-type biogenesis protein CcmF